MSAEVMRTASGSQTVGPFFKIGLEYLLDRTPEVADPAAAIKVHGRVVDRDGKPVPDALLEFWSAAGDTKTDASIAEEAPVLEGFRRSATDDAGHYTISMHKPASAPTGDGLIQAPHLLVLVFARGLLRHLMTRVYFEGEPANEADAVLQTVPEERRGTLIARRDGSNAFHWDIVLQGAGETVFFAW